MGGLIGMWLLYSGCGFFRKEIKEWKWTAWKLWMVGLEVLNFPPSHLVVLRGSRQGIRLAGPKPV